MNGIDSGNWNLYRRAPPSSEVFPYSYLSAIVGSIFIARRAGIKAAIVATVLIRMVTATKLTSSVGLIRNRMDDKNRVTNSDAMIPVADPMNTNIKPCLNVCARIILRVAPRAIRTPISFVR